MRKLISKTKNGEDVYLDTDTSHSMTHFKHHPKLLDVVEHIIPTLEGGGEWIRVEKDLGEIIGTTDLVETVEGDEIVYALRPRRSIYSRFVKGKESTPTSWITIALRKSEGGYDLYTAFVGRDTPSFPGGDHLSEQSKEFWSTHALVWGSQEVIPGTETPLCPW